MKLNLRHLSILAAIGVAAAVIHFSGPSGCSANCGNGVVDEGETCDDGNTASGDGCSSSCETESSGTTGGGTTGGGTTGGTTGGSSGACTTPADCPASFSSAPVCEKASECQGSRLEATCTNGVCGSITVPDDSACTADSFTLDCSPDDSLSCDGTVSQIAPACEDCTDGVDNDGDGLIDCADTVACPNTSACKLPSLPCPSACGFCSGGLCAD